VFQFSFSTKKLISRNESLFPVSLDDVKKFSQFYKNNPDTEEYNSMIENYWIPIFVKDWERTTNFLLLDTTVQAFVPDIGTISGVASNISLKNLNVREVSSVKFYPESWNQSDPKTTLETSKYLLSDEVYNIPINLNIKAQYLPFRLYPKTLNLEINYSCGFQGNNFENIPSEIISTIAMQVAMQVDSKEGLSCGSEYAPFIEQVYSEYTLREQLVTMII